MLAGLSARLAPLGQPRGGLTSPQTAPGAAARLTHARRPANRRPQAAAAAGGDRNGGGGASGPRRPRTIALAAASRAPFGEVLPAELLAKYQEQQQAEAHAGGRPFVLPLLVFPLPELPTESLALPVQEGCYREMFALVERSASRLFGAVLAHPEAQSIESVGALCELTTLVRADQPGQPLLLVNARVVGRFRTTDILCSEPFVAVLAEPYSDRSPADEFEGLALAAQEQRVWRQLLQVLALGDALAPGVLNGRWAARLEAALENEELLRWSPSLEARAAVPTAPAADPALLARVQALGLLGDPATLAQRTSDHLCLDALRPVSEAQRRERFSFALAAALGLDARQQQDLLDSQSTAERLHAAEQVLLQWRARLAACKSLRELGE